MKALVYADEGVSHFSLQEVIETLKGYFPIVEPVSSHILSSADWEGETSLLVFPGGRDIPYDRKLKGKGLDKIRTFIEQGGKFLGICAGGYFGAAEVVFEKGTSIEVHEKRDLKFFPGTAEGTLYPQASFKYDSEQGVHAAELSLEGNAFHCYYNGGCAFKDAESFEGVAILARYKDAQDQAAIIHCKVGKGDAILSGVHFEVNPKNLKRKEYPSMVIEKLNASDPQRKAFLQTLIKRLELK